MSIIHTRRLTLRPFRENDAEAMYQSWTYDERVARYCRWHPHGSAQETCRLLEMYLRAAHNGFDYRWGIEMQDSGELIGCIDVVGFDEENKTAEIGYVLSFDYWNRGLMSEALSAVIERLFCDGFETVCAEHHVDNPASGRVMEKCGMKYTHTAQTLRKFGSDERCSVRRYAIHRRDTTTT